ncbi:unnamed protein product [Scytosiphon promiscuus]
MEGRGGKGSPGGRTLPKRTYGSKQGSGRLFGPKYGQHQAGGDKSSGLSVAAASTGNRSETPPALLLPAPTNARLTYGEALGSGTGLLLQQSARKFGYAAGGGVRSTEEISHLISAAGEGGDNGRTSAIALAQACKSRRTRSVIRANAGDVLSELTSALHASLGVGERDHRQRDEATVHGLAVAMFVISKDRGLVKAFSASAVSALAVLIEGDGRRNAAPESSPGTRTTTTTGGAAGGAVAAVGRRHKSALRGGTLRPIDEKHSSGSRSSAGGKGPSPFGMSDEGMDEGESHGWLGGSGGVGEAPGGASSAGNNQRLFAVHGSAHNTAGRDGLPHARVNDHGSANAMVRARMLLDIADMVPWGMANRHLVSAADLGLATLLNVAAQACPDSGERGGGAAGGTSAGDPADEDVGTQSSIGSLSEPSSVVGAPANEHADDGEATAVSNNAGVMPELSRLAPSGFLLPVVVDGATVLLELSAEPSDPSPLRAIHQLLLALRVLDLATLESSGEADGAAAKASKGVDPAEPRLPHHYAELTGALLLVVARCQPLCGDGTLTDSAGGERVKASAGRFGQGRKQQQQSAASSPSPAVGGEVAGKVHQCLLAALRVLINVTHHDARVCAEVASRRGLETLTSCLVTRSCCVSTGRDAGDSGGLAAAPPRSDLELLGDVVNGATEDFPGTGSEEGRSDVGEADATRGDFDAQVLTMSALINCVELKESARNCVAMASLAQHGESRIRAERSLLSSRCLAPEFLAKLLIRSTRSFAHQLEGGRSGEDDEDGLASPAASGREHRREGADSSEALDASLAAETVESAASAAVHGADSGEQLMSHAEGTDLVLGGHCALLLGLLVRGHESNRRLALPVLPDGDPTLIVRVLEAFMALQFQAGVLTEEIVLAVQGLVEELEALEPVPAKEWNPFEIDAADQDEDVVVGASPGAASSIHSVTRSSPQRGRKRPRTATSSTTYSDKMPSGVKRTFVTPPSGQWVVEGGGEGNDGADGFSLSVKGPQADSQGEDTSPLWLTQSPSSEETPPPELPEPSSSSSPASTKAASVERSAPATTPSKNSKDRDPGETLESGGLTPGSTRPSSSWRIAGSSIAGRTALGLRGRSASTTRSWLGSSPQLRTYRNRSIYGSQTLRKPSSSRPQAELNSSSSNRRVGKGAQAGREGRPSSAVFEILSDDSEESTQGLGVVNGGGSLTVAGGGVGSRIGRSEPLAASTTTSTFDLDDWSDSSNDGAEQRNNNKGATKPRRVRVATCQLHSLATTRGKCNGGGADGDNFGSGDSDDDQAARWTKSDRSRSRSPSPKAPAVTARAGEGHPRPFQGAAARGRLGQAKGGVTSAPATGSSSSSSASEWRVGAGTQPGRSEGKSDGVLRVAAGLRPSAPGDRGGPKGRLGGAKEPAVRGGLEADRAVGKGKGILSKSCKPASGNVFEMSDEDESD